MSKVYLADKDTLDTVNNKVGASTEVESSTPATLFSGLKYIIQGVIELKNCSVMAKQRLPMPSLQKELQRQQMRPLQPWQQI